MTRNGFGFAGAGAALFCLVMASAAPAQEVFPPGRPTAQELQQMQSTYIVRFNGSVAASEVPGRANAIAARFGGLITHTYDTALKGFAIRMNERALNNMIRTSGLDIVSVSRDGPVLAYAPGGGKGKPDKPGGGDGGGGGGGGSCGEELGWDITRITDMTQADTSGTEPCTVSGGASVDYSGTTLKVCVIDTGVYAQHPDLNVVKNLGKNFSSDKGGTDDLNGHGTHVAGTIGAFANNNIGVVGVAPGAPIIPIKVLNRRGSGSYSDVIAGVNYAAQIDCDVANMSLGGGASTILDEAVKGARNTGVVFTLAAGNSADDISNYSPARASTGSGDNIYTIASFKSGDVWSYFSNYDGPGAGVVDFALPGQNVKSTWNDGGYNTISGTSMAAPHMAGLLVRAMDGAVLATEVDQIQRTAYPSGAPTTDYYDVAVENLLEVAGEN